MSILPVVAKVFEALIISQVRQYLKENDLLLVMQSGFRPWHCTQDVLLKTVDDWRYTLDNNEVVGAVFIDLSRAFDSILHPLLVDKLYRYGVRGDVLSWFKNYLSGRRQMVSLGEASVASDWIDIQVGVPRGSILGSLLFSLFINDLPNVLCYCNIMLYADVTTMYFSSASIDRRGEALIEDRDTPLAWCEGNGMKVNVRKTKFMSLSRSSRRKEAGWDEWGGTAEL